MLTLGFWGFCRVKVWGFRTLKVFVRTALAVGLLAAATDAFARTCEIALRLDDSVTLGALQLTLLYQDAPGSFLTKDNGDVKCFGDAPNTLVPFLDDPVLRTITASFVSLAGIAGPRKIAHCWFSDPTDSALPGDFRVVVEEATKVDGRIIKAPRISVLLPDCGPDWTPTTTTTTLDTTTTTSPVETTTTLDSTTTTTLAPETTTTSTSTTSSTTETSTTSTTSTTEPWCGNGIVDELEDCDDGNADDGDGCDSACSSLVLCGDANGNDRLQTTDALLVLRAAVGQQIPCPAERCDADGDQFVRVADSLRILKRAVGHSIEMSCPFEE
jgi:cysteine-rich repeat protein